MTHKKLDILYIKLTLNVISLDKKHWKPLDKFQGNLKYYMPYPIEN